MCRRRKNWRERFALYTYIRGGKWMGALEYEGYMWKWKRCMCVCVMDGPHGQKCISYSSSSSWFKLFEKQTRPYRANIMHAPGTCDAAWDVKERQPTEIYRTHGTKRALPSLGWRPPLLAVTGPQSFASKKLFVFYFMHSTTKKKVARCDLRIIS